MKFLFQRLLTLSLLLAAANSLSAAETASRIKATSNPNAAQATAQGDGDWVRSATRVRPHLSLADAVAVDADGLSLSTTSVYRTLDGRLIGNTINITVGPGRGAAATGHAQAEGQDPGVAIGGKSRPGHGRVNVKAQGDRFHTKATSRSFLGHPMWKLIKIEG